MDTSYDKATSEPSLNVDEGDLIISANWRKREAAKLQLQSYFAECMANKDTLKGKTWQDTFVVREDFVEEPSPPDDEESIALSENDMPATTTTPCEDVASTMSKSKSTVLLMGHMVPVNPGNTSPANLGQGNDLCDDVALLVETSTTILSTIQVLRRIIKDHTCSQVGRELRHLSLTVACFERVLFSFIKDEIICDPQIDYRNKQALKDIIPLIPTEKRHTILAGGVASLLRQVIVSVTDTKQVLLSLSENYDPYWENRWSFTPFTLLALAIWVTRRRFVDKLSFRSIFNLLRPSFKQVQYGVFVLVCYDYVWRFYYRFSTLRKIKVHHSRVSLTLRLFLLCEHVLDRTRLSRSASTRLLIDAPVEADINDNLKSATSLLVERVPLPGEYYDRSHEPLGMKLFKTGSYVMCASSYTTKWFLGSWYPAIGPYLVNFLLPYYAIRHRKAAALATRVCMDSPEIEVIRMAWNIFGESWLAVRVAELQSPTLAVRTEIFVKEDGQAAGPYRRKDSDIGVRIFSCRPIASVKQGSWEQATVRCSAKMQTLGLPTSTPVLFYIHGGGFFGRFWAKDIVNLSAWAVELGAVIVYVDYSLSPEAKYPVPLNQCFTVYKWVLQGGLGFVPSSVAMFGESAGGNLAAALCLKCIQDRVVLPKGLVLVHPALTCNFSPSPSRFLHQSDPVLPRGILELALNSYYPHNDDQYKNPKMSDPLVAVGLADDSLLKRFPPTTLLVGDTDPLLDDSVDFYTRLNNLNVEAKLKVLPGLTHGFLIYPDLVPAAQRAVDDIANHIYGIFRQEN
ncbi:Aste57867_22453 [Aphanomyces stellatus]|uniref:Aste57867_22453 protein n=1 Tax=Aphanomyces stellatus TaxID=120398 RepID=A0A485LK45_9STRA|nr:hypothetical protein As57867_022383 [Aphanomyces stellatus]VFT99113.1 Aste57867_22453 [Aphanomyces stellatus]